MHVLCIATELLQWPFTSTTTAPTDPKTRCLDLYASGDQKHDLDPKMATPQQQQVVKQWLDRVLTPYPSSDTISREALTALAKYPMLSIKTDAYSQSRRSYNLAVRWS